MQGGKKVSVHGLDVHNKSATSFQATPCTYYGGNDHTTNMQYAYIAVGY